MEQTITLSPLPTVYLGNVRGRLRIECKTSSIHGQGIFTTEAVEKNECFFYESPACYHTKLFDSFSEASISGATSYLSQDEQVAFQALHHSLGHLYKDGTLGRFLSNAFELPSQAKGYVTKALFLAAAKLNHSPSSNSRIYWNNRNETISIEALRALETGEEVTIAYCCRQRITESLDIPSLECKCNCKKCSSAEGQSGGKEGQGNGQKCGGVWTGACLCNVCSFEYGGGTPSTPNKDEGNNSPAKVLTDEMMALSIEDARLQQGAVLMNSASWPITSSSDVNGKFSTGIHANFGGVGVVKGKERSEQQNSDHEDEFFDDESDDGLDDYDDLENLDVRPGLHGWLE